MIFAEKYIHYITWLTFILEGKRSEITKDTPGFYHPESFYTSRPLSKLIEKADSLKLSSDSNISNLSIPKYFD